MTNQQRDGAFSVTGNGGGVANYYPNTHPKTLSNPEVVPSAAIQRFDVSGVVGRFPHDHPNSDWAQPGDFFRRVLDAPARERLVQNIVGSLSGARKETQARMIDVFTRVDKEYGRMVAEGLKKKANL